MIFKLFFLSLAMMLAPVCTWSTAKTLADSYEVFPIGESPKPSEWKLFMSMEMSESQKLWQYHKNRGKKITDWAWEWRLGWVRKCILGTDEFCVKILQEGLRDKALVVRAETATLIGQRFASSGHKPAIELLIQSYRNPSNFRNNKPLWVQYRILEAIKRIGGPDAPGIASKLAGEHASTKSYWIKTNRF